MTKFRLSMAIAMFCAFTFGATSELHPPDDLAAEDISNRGFLASWHDEESVDGYWFGLWHLGWKNWSGTRQWRETFARCICPNLSDKAIAGASINDYTDNSGWGGEMLYLATGFNGVIRIGKAADTGLLVSPPLSAMNGLTLVLRARAYKAQPNMRLGIMKISGGTTNLVEELTLTTKMTDYALANIEIASGDRLAFRSFTTGKQRRVLMDSVELVGDYVPGEIQEEKIGDDVRVAALFAGSRHQVDGLTPGESYQFRVCATREGEWSSWSEPCRVDLPAESEPEDMLNVAAERLAEGGFALSWNRIVNAESYRITVWTNATSGGCEGEAVWQESFSKSPASSSTAALSFDRFNAEFADRMGVTDCWTVVSNVYPSKVAGTVRIGSTEKKGLLESPPLQFGGDVTLRIKAWRMSSDDGCMMPVEMECEGVVSRIATFRLDDEAKEYFVKLPKRKGSYSIRLLSTEDKKSSRVILDDVTILLGYDPGLQEMEVVTGPMTTTTNVQNMAGYADATYDYAVEALDARGAVLTFESNRVDVAKLPQLPVLEAIEVSKLPDGIFTEDFASLQVPFPKKTDSTSDWLNGVTLRYWHAYQDGQAPTKLTRNLGKSAIGGLYAYWNGSDSDTYSLGMNVGSDHDDYVCGVVFFNDTDRCIAGFTVGYEGRQFGFRNSIGQRIDFELLVTNCLTAVKADGAWQRIERLGVVTPAAVEDGLVSGESGPIADAVLERVRIKIPPRQYLAVRWRREHVTNSAAFAIDNVKITLEKEAMGMSVLIR